MSGAGAGCLTHFPIPSRLRRSASRQRHLCCQRAPSRWSRISTATCLLGVMCIMSSQLLVSDFSTVYRAELTMEAACMFKLFICLLTYHDTSTTVPFTSWCIDRPTTIRSVAGPSGLALSAPAHSMGLHTSCLQLWSVL